MRRILGREDAEHTEAISDREDGELTEEISRRAHSEQESLVRRWVSALRPTPGSRGGAHTNGRCDGCHSCARLLSIYAARSAAPTARRLWRMRGRGACLCSL